MQVEIKYETHSFRGDKETKQEDFEWWLRSQLEAGGIEAQIKLLRELVAAMAADWLLKHPDRLCEIACETACEGWGHELVVTPD